jgi:hypothetical protein
MFHLENPGWERSHRAGQTSSSHHTPIEGGKSIGRTRRFFVEILERFALLDRYLFRCLSSGRLFSRAPATVARTGICWKSLL